ncbi:hypothetical protein B0H14DRAFT_3521702 [Mycena olivaceomarginata]|nr:hypothetical protein B0H14DRAFT_3521702 [Mycena olivaceomarginata]
MWYTHLRNLLKQHYTDKIDTLREQLLVAGEPDSPNTPAPPRGTSSRANLEPARPRDNPLPEVEVVAVPAQQLRRPLGRRLPLLPSSPPPAARTSSRAIWNPLDLGDTPPQGRGRGSSSAAASSVWDRNPPESRRPGYRS